MDVERPDEYYFVTSRELSRTQKDTLLEELSPHLVNSSGILGLHDLNNLLGKYKCVEEDHFKLWMPSVGVLRRALNLDTSGPEGSVEIPIDSTQGVRSIFGDANSTFDDPDFIVIGEIPDVPAEYISREICDILMERFERSVDSAVCALVGMRGVGKTHVAASCARSLIAGGRGLVGWVSAETEIEMLSGLTRIAEKLGVAAPNGDPVESARRLREHLAVRTGSSLIVFDDARDPDALRPYLPSLGVTKVVITTTDRQFAELGHTIEVDVFARAESRQILEIRTGLSDKAGADAVAEQLGDLPLAIAAAAATIRARGYSYSRYLDRLRQETIASALKRRQGQQYPRSVEAALLLAIDAVQSGDTNGITTNLLMIVSVLSHKGMGRELLPRIPLDVEVVEAAIERCVRGSVLSYSIGGRAIIMHRLTRQVVRERVGGNNGLTWAACATLDLLDPDLDDQITWHQRESVVNAANHIEALWKIVKTHVANKDIVGRVLYARKFAAHLLCMIGADTYGALHIHRDVVKECEIAFDFNHPNTLSARNALAFSLERAGKLSESIKLFEKTLHDCERIHGVNHINTYRTFLGLAGAYESAGRSADAVGFYERALADAKRIFGIDHPRTWDCRNDLAVSYRAAARTVDAIQLSENVLSDSERRFGSNHRNTIVARNNLAIAYNDGNRKGDAIDLLVRALGDAEHLLGVGHPSTISVRNSLAAMYAHMERGLEAIGLLKKSLCAVEQDLGQDHIETVIMEGELASIYMQSDCPNDAIACYERAIATAERLDTDHPLIDGFRKNLATAYVSQGKWDAAILLLEGLAICPSRVPAIDARLALLRRNQLAAAYMSTDRAEEAIGLWSEDFSSALTVLGPDHPDTRIIRENLLEAYQSEGCYPEIISILEKILTESEVLNGPDRDDIRSLLTRLARAYHESDRYADAVPFYERALTIAEETLGLDHAETLVICNNLADDYDLSGRSSEAIHLFERTFKDRMRTLGMGDPATIATLANLIRAHCSADRHGAAAITLYEGIATDNGYKLDINHPATRTLYNNVATAYAMTGRYAEAVSLLAPALASAELANGADSVEALALRKNIAAISHAREASD